MDGLTIKTGGGASVGGEFGIGRASENRNSIGAPLGTPKQSDFGSTLDAAINSVNTLQQDADIKIQKLATGQSENLHDTMIAVEKADIALKLMMQVRNKMIEAYQEVMKMQV